VITTRLNFRFSRALSRARADFYIQCSSSPSLRERIFASGRTKLVPLCRLLSCLLLCSSPLIAQAKVSAPKSSAAKVAIIKSFRVIQEKDGPAVEVLATFSLVPQIQLISNPTRLVIDLPNARIDSPKRFNTAEDEITELRCNQVQQSPPIARLVADLSSARTYTWQADGNRLVVRLGKGASDSGPSPFQSPTVVGLSQLPQPVVKAVRASGPITVATDAGIAGSSFAAGADTAILSLSSGGELRVCPHTTLSILHSQDRHNLMLGMSNGALETHVELDSTMDSIMTPDFRITLVGPGEFHYAFSADNRGNTCVRSLPGDTEPLLVTELLADRTYRVKPTDQLVFRNGQLDRVDSVLPPECGCPPPRQTMLRASNNAPAQDLPRTAIPSSSNHDAQPAANSQPPANPSILASASIAGPYASETPAPINANPVHVQVVAPLVFVANGPPPVSAEELHSIPFDSRPTNPAMMVVPVAPSSKIIPMLIVTASASPHPGFFHRLGSFFGTIFR
jgi:hypothetical protein